MKILKVLAFAALGIFGFYGALNPQAFWFLDGVTALFHEAGHVFFMFFGKYLHVLGGTILQIGFPLGIGLAFYFKRQKASAAVMFWWAAETFVPVSKYIQDARDQSQPFIGGEEHDWGYLLNVHRVIQYDRQIGEAVWLAGLLLMIAAAVFGIYTVLKEKSDAGR